MAPVLLAGLGLAVAAWRGGSAQAALGCEIATIRWDAGASTTSWETAKNWSGDRLPISTDHVCINAGTAVVLNSTTAVQSLDSRKALTLSSGTLTVGSTSQRSTITGGLTISGGALSGAGARELRGTLTWTRGALEGPGLTTIAAGVKLGLSGTDFRPLRGPVANAGTISIASAGTLSFEAGAVLTNTGVVELIGDTVVACCGTDARMRNAPGGLLVKRSGVTSPFDVALENDGIVRSEQGTLRLSGPTPASVASEGTFGAVAGATLAFAVDTTTIGTGGKLAGPGQVVLESGELSGPLTILNGARLVWRGGTLSGPTSGDALVAAGGRLLVEGTVFKTFENRLRNLGQVLVAAGSGASFGSGARLQNDALTVLEGSAALDGGASQVIVNSPTGTVDHTGDVASVGTIDVPLDNDGVVQSSRGRLDLSAGTPTAAFSAGRYSAATGATLRIAAGTHAFAAGGSFSGPGTHVLQGGTVSGPWTVARSTTLTFAGGALHGTPSGAPAKIVAGGTLLVPNHVFKRIGGLIDNAGVVRMDGSVSTDNLTTITNRAIFELIDAAEIGCCGGSGPNVLVNVPTGRILKKGGAATTATIDLPFENDGLAQSQAGVLLLTGGSPAGRASEGIYAATAGHTLAFRSGTHQFGAGGRILGPGTVVVDGATVQGPWAVRSGGRLTHVTGHLSGSAAGGTASVDAGGRLTSSRPDFKTMGGLIRVAGAWTVDGDVLFGGVTTNVGVIEIAGTGLLDCCAGPAPQAVVSTGVIRKTGLASSVGEIEVALDNDGVVTSSGGTLLLHGGTGATAEAVGQYGAAAGHRVEFGFGVHNLGVGSRIVGPGNVTVDGATVRGPWTVKPGGRLVHVQGRLEGPPASAGTAVVEPGGTLAVERPDFKTFAGALRNDGVVRYTGETGLDTGTTVLNNATIELAGAPFVDCFGSCTQLIRNSPTGAIRKTGTASSVATLDVPVENGGVVQSDGGTLELTRGSGTGTSTGDFRGVAGGGTVELSFGTHRFDPGAEITGPGKVLLSGGVAVGPLAIRAGGVLTHTAGVLSAPLNGTGALTVDGGGLLQVTTDGFKSFKGPIRNNGLLRVTGEVNLDTGADITNTGTLELGGAGLIDCCSGTGTRRVVNAPAGLVRVTGGTPWVDPPFDNQGTVRVEAGAVHFAAPLDFTGGVLREGTWHVKGQLGLGAGGMTSNATELVLDGPLAAVVGSDGTDTLDTVKSNTGTLTINNRSLTTGTLTNRGTLVLGPATELELPGLVQAAGATAISPTATLRASGGVDLNGGVLQGTGKIVGALRNTGTSPPVRLQPGGELDLEGAYTQAASGVFDVELSNTGTGTAQRQLLGTNGGTLGGTLRVRTSDAFTPVAGETFVLGTFVSRTGTFSTLDLDTPADGFAFQPFYTGTEFGVRVVVAP